MNKNQTRAKEKAAQRVRVSLYLTKHLERVFQDKYFIAQLTSDNRILINSWPKRGIDPVVTQTVHPGTKLHRELIAAAVMHRMMEN